ncbi:protein PHYTOCHROME KINASE SUBSTRATE 2-like [Rutidosis leptorrhynchoides]|uniref:protein PHYTOCHROME KINASE SUBSTRATE 2-like n=1 Tax=Rutidosis leptorrhynchoides TaxID=125765 RepID=UPI003A99C17D
MITSNASFSYSNEHTSEERFALKLTKKNVEDDEIGIFGAEKYFKGVIDEELIRTSKVVHNRSNQPQEPCPPPKPKTPSSVRSESSWNSRRGLLISNNNNDRGKKTSVKSLLTSLGFNCNDKASVEINDKKVHVKEPMKQPVKGGDLVQTTKALSSKRVDEDVQAKKFEVDEMNFTFPVLNSSMMEVEQDRKKSFSLERKLNMLKWDGVTPKAENIDLSRNGGQNDTGSDASSDLFEIESFSTNENNMFLAHQAMENNGYAPSEVSVDWSVATASVADFSTADDLMTSRTVKGVGMLLGCKSHKAVRVSGDEYHGEKAAVMMGPAKREWCRRLDSVTPLAKIQADNKLIGVASDLYRGQNRFSTTHSIHGTHSMHASHHLCMSQKPSSISH